MQNHLSSLQGDISLQFETLLTTVNSQKERITGVEETTQKVNSMYQLERIALVPVDFGGLISYMQNLYIFFDHFRVLRPQQNLVPICKA